MNIVLTQKFPPRPSEDIFNLPSANGKVFVVTGGYGGVGYHLTQILYQAGARVYMLGRSERKAQAAIDSIYQASKNLSEALGSIVFIQVDLSDLTSVKAAAESLLSQETRLDVLFNNAGISGHPLEPRSAQNYDMHVATNVLGPYLLTNLLAESLKATKGRVIWTASLLVDVAAPKGGFDMERDVHNTPSSPNGNYTISKVCNWMLASEMTKRSVGAGVISLAINPGSLWTDAWRYQSWWTRLFVYPGLYDAKYGAYTNLWAAHASIPAERNGGYVIPWGRWHPQPRADIVEGLVSRKNGGTGLAEDLWEWCNEQVSMYL